MTYSEMRVDMRIIHKSGRKATIGAISKGQFRIVDSDGNVEDLDRYYAGEWEPIR